MNQNLATADYIVFIIYFIIVAGYGYTIYHRRKRNEHDAKAFFLAEGTLTWWAIGASLIASNISAEQFIGMSGEGFFLGIAVAAYEWIAAIALIIVAVWFIPVIHFVFSNYTHKLLLITYNFLDQKKAKKIYQNFTYKAEITKRVRMISIRV